MLTHNDMADLKNLLISYKSTDENGSISLYKGDWAITEGGYDKWWELYYGENAEPIADCIAGEVNVFGKFSLTEKVLIKDIILEYLDYLKIYN